PSSACSRFFFYCSCAHRDLHSFPTRRSSDLGVCTPARGTRPRPKGPHSPFPLPRLRAGGRGRGLPARRRKGCHLVRPLVRKRARSEEHTSELQSRENLVCRLLLEKKKQTHLS